MAAFVPTVETLGDEVLTNSIIDRSLVELYDDSIVTPGKYAFSGFDKLKTVHLEAATSLDAASVFEKCSALERVVLPNVKTVGTRPFYSCTKLTFVDFGSLEQFGKSNAGIYPFEGVSNLETLIIRTNAVCARMGNNNTIPAKNIYVPRDLVDSYKSNSSWSTYASKIKAIEDYPEVCDPYSWAAVAANIENGTYKDVYKIGDEVPVDLGSEGLINMQVAAFDADTLADGSGTAAISWVAKELLVTSKRMSPARAGSSGAYTEGTGAIGGWDKCEMRTYLQNAIKPTLPADVANMVVFVSKTQDAYDTANNRFTQTTADDLWLPSKNEVYDTGGMYTGLFSNNEARVKCGAGTTTPKNWWTRSPSTYNSSNYYMHNSSGSSSNTTAGTSCGVCLGFCTGRTPA